MNKPKTRIKEPFRLRFKKRVAYAFLGLVVVGGASYASINHVDEWYANLEEFIAKTIDARVEHIMVEGVNNVGKQDMADALGLRKGDSLVGFDAATARQNLEDLAWVRDAVVERKLPDTVTVKVYEYTPIARLEDENGVWVVDRLGNRIVTLNEGFENLPLIRGENAEDQAADLIQLLQLEQTVGMPKVAEAKFIGERRWNLGFETDAWVMLPEKNPAHAMRILTKLHKAKGVLNIEGGMVDLRLEDRIVLRMPQNEKKRERLL